MASMLISEPAPAALVAVIRAPLPPGITLDAVSSLAPEDFAGRAIASGHLGGAGLDMLRREADGGNPFTDLAQVLVTPQVRGVSRAAEKRILRLAVANIGRFLPGQLPLNLVPGLVGQTSTKTEPEQWPVNEES